MLVLNKIHQECFCYHFTLSNILQVAIHVPIMHDIVQGYFAVQGYTVTVSFLQKIKIAKLGKTRIILARHEGGGEISPYLKNHDT